MLNARYLIILIIVTLIKASEQQQQQQQHVVCFNESFVNYFNKVSEGHVIEGKCNADEIYAKCSNDCLVGGGYSFMAVKMALGRLYECRCGHDLNKTALFYAIECNVSSLCDDKSPFTTLVSTLRQSVNHFYQLAAIVGSIVILSILVFCIVVTLPTYRLRKSDTGSFAIAKETQTEPNRALPYNHDIGVPPNPKLETLCKTPI